MICFTYGIPIFIAASGTYIGVDPYIFYIQRYNTNLFDRTVIQIATVVPPIHIDLDEFGNILPANVSGINFIYWPEYYNALHRLNKEMENANPRGSNSWYVFQRNLLNYRGLQALIQTLRPPEESLTLLLMGTGLWLSSLFHFLTIRPILPMPLYLVCPLMATAIPIVGINRNILCCPGQKFKADSSKVCCVDVNF